MRYLLQIAWAALLFFVLGCETPERDESPQAPGGSEREQRQTAERGNDEPGAADEALAFDALPASDDGVREALLYAAPSKSKSRALLWIFHGRGDSRNWCRRNHIQPALRAFHDSGVAIVCPQTVDRDAKAWDGGNRDRAGPDIANVRRAREPLRSQGVVADDLPEFGWGVSNGGGFVGTWAHHALSDGVDVRGLHCMIASCESAAAIGGSFDLRIHWAAAENDPFFSIRGVRSTHQHYDGPKSLVVAEPAPLTASTLESLAGLPSADARELHGALTRDGLLDGDDVPSCDPKASSRCRTRLAEAYHSVEVGASPRAVRYAYENCRATHTEFHTTCDGDDNTAEVLQAFRAELGD